MAELRDIKKLKEGNEPIEVDKELLKGLVEEDGCEHISDKVWVKLEEEFQNRDSKKFNIVRRRLNFSEYLAFMEMLRNNLESLDAQYNVYLRNFYFKWALARFYTDLLVDEDGFEIDKVDEIYEILADFDILDFEFSGLVSEAQIIDLSKAYDDLYKDIVERRNTLASLVEKGKTFIDDLDTAVQNIDIDSMLKLAEAVGGNDLLDIPVVKEFFEKLEAQQKKEDEEEIDDTEENTKDKDKETEVDA